MPDWSHIPIQEFDKLALEDERLSVLVRRIVLDRLPFTFDTKRQYLNWRDRFADELECDGHDIVLVGSAATGRSLSARKKFKVFDKTSDVDIAVISPTHFDRAWTWFRRTDPNLLTGLDDAGRTLFENHRKHHIFEGVIAANYFLSYLPFGNDWMHALRRSEEHLPQQLKGRILRMRIYKDAAALRESQQEALATFRRSRQVPPGDSNVKPKLP
ncbi:hypothetical protein ACLESD_15730 [Pyxidicoccus sp. 3LFB2]